jgi:lipid-A-disaccharide synthase-like uncharacterized protein
MGMAVKIKKALEEKPLGYEEAGKRPQFSLREWGSLFWSQGVKAVCLTGGLVLILTLLGVSLRLLLRFSLPTALLLTATFIPLRVQGIRQHSPLVHPHNFWGGLGQLALVLVFTGRLIQIFHSYSRGGLLGVRLGLGADLLLGLVFFFQFWISEADRDEPLGRAFRWFWALGAGALLLRLALIRLLWG